MKKTLLLVLVVLLTSIPVFAGVDGFLGLSFAPDFMWYSMGESSEEKADFSISYFDIEIEGATYFGNKHQFGIAYGFGFGIPMSIEVEGQSGDTADMETVFIPQGSLQYRYCFNDSFSLGAGAGVKYMFQTIKEGGMEMKTGALSMTLNTGVSFKMFDFLSLQAGVDVGIPLLSNMTTSVGGTSVTADIDVMGVSVTPYLGIGYAY